MICLLDLSLVVSRELPHVGTGIVRIGLSPFQCECVIFVLICFLVLVLVFQLFFRFSFVLVFIIFFRFSFSFRFANYFLVLVSF